MEKTIEYLKEIVAIPSPTGYTQMIQAYLVETLTTLGYDVECSNKGNVTVTIEGIDTGHHRVVTAHVDTLGAIVRAIKPDGRLKLDRIGGFAWNMIEGENCLVHIASRQTTTTGTILLHQTSVHVYREAGKIERSQDNIEVRLDERVIDVAGVRALGIDVGDFVSFDPRFTVTEQGFVKSRFLDDKVSVAILLAILEQFSQTGTKLPLTTHFTFSVYEEVGHGMNSTIPPQTVEYLAVDMGAIGDDQQTDEYTVSICVKDASGPYHYDFRQQLVALAQQNDIPFKLDIYPYYGSDASAAMRAGADVQHALIGSGIESSHSYERTHRESIKQTKRLLEAYLASERVGDHSLASP